MLMQYMHTSPLLIKENITGTCNRAAQAPADTCLMEIWCTVAAVKNGRRLLVSEPKNSAYTFKTYILRL